MRYAMTTVIINENKQTTWYIFVFSCKKVNYLTLLRKKFLYSFLNMYIFLVLSRMWKYQITINIIRFTNRTWVIQKYCNAKNKIITHIHTSTHVAIYLHLCGYIYILILYRSTKNVQMLKKSNIPWKWKI